MMMLVSVPDIPMENVFTHLQGMVQKSCLILIPLLLLIKMGIIILKGLSSGQSYQFHTFYPGIILWIFIAAYPEVIGKVNLVGDFLVNIISAPIDDPVTSISLSIYEARAFREAAYHKKIDESTGKIASGEVWTGISGMGRSTWGALVDGVKQYGQDSVASLISIFAALVRMFIETVRAMLLKFLITIGPLALTFSILQSNHTIAHFWFQKLISVFCWALTLNILDHLVIDYYHQVAVQPAISSFLNAPALKQETPYYMDQLIVGAMYTMVPFLTSLYLGGYNSYHFLGNTFRLFTSLVTTALSTTNSIISKK